MIGAGQKTLKIGRWRMICNAFIIEIIYSYPPVAKKLIKILTKSAHIRIILESSLAEVYDLFTGLFSIYLGIFFINHVEF